MKIFVESRMKGERQIMRKLLDSYHQTPHPSTGITTGAVTFRDELKSTFLAVSVKYFQNIKDSRRVT